MPETAKELAGKELSKMQELLVGLAGFEPTTNRL